MPSEWAPLQHHYERCLEQAGATPQGVDWPNAADLEARFAVQSEILSGLPGECGPPVLLDLGCGPGLFLDWIQAARPRRDFTYYGIDISPAMIAAARDRWPGERFEARDILAEPLPARSVDVVIMNGVLTERCGIPRQQMVAMAEALVAAAFQAARHGIAFNAMSQHVDWQREDLFHWGFDEVVGFLKRRVTRNIAIRADYGLYEFTCFAWRAPRRPDYLGPVWWARGLQARDAANEPHNEKN